MIHGGAEVIRAVAAATTWWEFMGLSMVGATAFIALVASIYAGMIGAARWWKGGQRRPPGPKHDEADNIEGQDMYVGEAADARDALLGAAAGGDDEVVQM